MSNDYKIPKKMQAKFDEITELIDAVCKAHLNEEYAEMSRQLTAALARKRPSLLERGRTDIWACGIVYTIGFVNFLFDKSFEPYLSADELGAAFGVSKSSGGNKSGAIRDMLDIVQLDPRWTLPSQMDENPMAWMIMVDGFIMDARSAPPHIQEAAYHKGLILYIPSDRS